jgi:hypothetical protein
MLRALTRMEPLAQDPVVPRRGSADSFQAFLAGLDKGEEEGGEEEEQGEEAAPRPTPLQLPLAPTTTPLLPPVLGQGGGSGAGLVGQHAYQRQQQPPLASGAVLPPPPFFPRAAAADLRRAAAAPVVVAAPLPPPAPAPRRGRGRARSENGPETAQQRAHRRFYMRKKERVSFFDVGWLFWGVWETRALSAPAPAFAPPLPEPAANEWAGFVGRVARQAGTQRA